MKSLSLLHARLRFLAKQNKSVSPDKQGWRWGLLLLLFLPGAFLSAQTTASLGASEIDVLLETQAVSYSQAARFTLIAAGLVSEDADAAQAYTAAGDMGALVKGAEPDAPINLGALSFLIVRTFDAKGPRGASGLKAGILFTLFPGKHYGYRALQSAGLLPQPSDPGMKVSGTQLLQVLEQTLNYLGE
jgi:hypothetical protein